MSIAGLIDWIKSLFRWAVLDPQYLDIVHYQCDGCMAHDWNEKWRGTIIGRMSKVIYGSPSPVEFVLVGMEDGNIIECFADDCMPWTKEMLDRSKEDLTGKWVYLR